MSYRSSNILRWIFFKFQHNLNIDKPWSPFVFDGILNCCSRVMGLCSSKFRDFIECPTVAQISFDGFFSNFNTILIFINPDPLSFLTEFWIVVPELCDFVRQNFVISLTVLPYRIYHVRHTSQIIKLSGFLSVNKSWVYHLIYDKHYWQTFLQILLVYSSNCSMDKPQSKLMLQDDTLCSIEIVSLKNWTRWAFFYSDCTLPLTHLHFSFIIGQNIYNRFTSTPYPLKKCIHILKKRYGMNVKETALHAHVLIK